MSPFPANLTVLRRAFVDICAGHSVGHYEGRPLYVRHLTHRSHIQYEDRQTTFEEEALSKGGIREAARLAYLISKGLWSEQKDLEVERQRDTIVRFEDGRKTVAVPSMMEHYDRQIAEEREKLGKMLTERAQLLGVTVEVYAQQKLNDHYIITNVFADEGLTQPLVSPEVFEDMADSEVEVLLGAYHRAIDPCGDATLRRLAVQDFFSSYYGMCDDNVSTFYGRPVCELTYYQIRLGTIARHFKALMEHVDLSRVDPKARTDPDAIEKLYTTQKNASAMIAEGKVPANMTQQDITQMGLQKEISYVDKPESAMEIVQRLSRGRRG